MMKAVYLTKFGKPEEAFEIRETNIPKCAPNQVLIKAEAFGLNFADVLARKGLYGETPERFCIIGYEVVGRVEAQGKEVEENYVGKRVVALTRFGGYAEYAVTDHRAMGIIAENYPAEKALALATQYTTAHICFKESVNLYSGDRVLIHAAAGGVGIALCQMALNAGCEIFATAGSEKKLEFLRNMGVHHAINYESRDYSEVITSLLNENKIDAGFNSIAGNTIKKDWKLLGAGGKLVVFGAAFCVGKGSLLGGIGLVFKTGFLTPLLFIVQSKSLIGINILKLGDHKPGLVARSLKAVIAEAETGKLDPVVHNIYKIQELNEAHLALENRETIGKTAIFW